SLGERLEELRDAGVAELSRRFERLQPPAHARGGHAHAALAQLVDVFEAVDGACGQVARRQTRRDVGHLALPPRRFQKSEIRISEIWKRCQVVRNTNFGESSNDADMRAGIGKRASLGRAPAVGERGDVARSYTVVRGASRTHR